MLVLLTSELGGKYTRTSFVHLFLTFDIGGVK